MNAYLVIATNICALSGPPIQAADVFDLMMRHRCWEYADTAPHFPRMRPGDTLVFYLGGPRHRYFAGEAVVAGTPRPIEEGDNTTFQRDAVPFFRWRLPLQAIRRYPAHRATLDLVPRLSFARHSPVERKYIGLLLRGGVRPLTGEDLDLIRQAVGRTGSQTSSSEKGIRSAGDRPGFPGPPAAAPHGAPPRAEQR